MLDSGVGWKGGRCVSRQTSRTILALRHRKVLKRAVFAEPVGQEGGSY